MHNFVLVAPIVTGGTFVQVTENGKTRQYVTDEFDNIVFYHEENEFNGTWWCTEGILYFVPYGGDADAIWHEVVRTEYMDEAV